MLIDANVPSGTGPTEPGRLEVPRMAVQCGYFEEKAVFWVFTGWLNGPDCNQGSLEDVKSLPGYTLEAAQVLIKTDNDCSALHTPEQCSIDEEE